MHPWDAIWIFFILSSLQPVIQKQLLASVRRRMLARIASKRDATVITLIHRQESINLRLRSSKSSASLFASACRPRSKP